MLRFMLRFRFFIALFGFWAFVAPAFAQSQPAKGMVWDPPKDTAKAIAELQEMHQMGVEVVRTPLIWRPALYQMADSLHMQFYQELPFSGLPAKRLEDMLPFARKTLRKVIEKSRAYQSARHFGLAQFSDTSDSDAFAYFTTLMQVVRAEGESGTQGYFTSTFVREDAVAHLVDFVLLVAYNDDNPVEKVRRWQANVGGKPVGIVMGMGVAHDTRSGYLVENSPEAQARYLETSLRHLLVEKKRPVSVIFINRWKDGGKTDLYLQTQANQSLNYGLVGTDQKKRPAYDVVKGFYTDQQTVFAFKAGERMDQETFWVIGMGWLILALIAFAFLLSFRLQDILMRYFTAHRSFQDMLLRSRDALSGMNALLMVAFGLCAGLTGSVIFSSLRSFPAFGYFIETLPAVLKSLVLIALKLPFTFALLSMGFFGLFLVLIALIFYSVAIYLKQTHVTPQKNLMIAVWAQWPMLLLMLTAMVSFSVWGTSSIKPAMLLISFWGILNLTAYFQMVSDFSYVVRQPAWLMIMTGIGIFLVVFLVYFLFRFPAIRPEWTFLIHLVRESWAMGTS